MLHIKIFLSLLLLFVLSAFYWAYYFSNFYDFETEVVIQKEWIEKEEDLLETYRFDEIVIENKWESDALLSETWSYFFSWDGENSLSILSTLPNNKNWFLWVSKNIEILFSNYVELESLLWYIKWTWSTVTCPSWEVVDVVSGFSRCKDLNKIFLYREWQEKKMFSWIIKRWEKNKRNILLQAVPPLEGKVAYVLEIESGIKALSKSSNLETKEPRIIKFIALDTVWNSDSEPVSWSWTETWTWGELGSWSWNVLEVWTGNTLSWVTIWTWSALTWSSFWIKSSWTWVSVWTSTGAIRNTSSWNSVAGTWVILNESGSLNN